MRAFLGLILAALGLATALSGCAAESMFDRLPPELGGMPANAPARPATPYQYPAVHDMPPARPTQPMTEEEQWRLEKELQAARDRQESLAGTAKTATPATPVKTTVPTSQKKAATAVVVPSAGTKAAAPATQRKASTVAAVPPPGARAAAPAPKKKPATVIVVPPAGATTNP
jgi:hypothetical protein